MNTIIIATNNNDKIKEFKEILKGYDIKSLKDIGYHEDIEENGKTFVENATIKAKAVSLYLRQKQIFQDVIAEDSGICCNGLNGAPGIFSARYAGDHNDQANRDKIRKELENISDKTAYYISAIVLYHPDDSKEDFVGKTDGIIINEETGNNGFGYDPIFYSTELNKTFGQASKDEKNSVSHRGRAIEKLVNRLKTGAKHGKK